MYRALYSDRQLEEVLVDFWFNHFNVFENKNVQIQPNGVLLLLASYERDAIRLGKFKICSLATARHPAMLFYLDNWESISLAPSMDFQVGRSVRRRTELAQFFSRQAHGLNENYGREVMELHTLGGCVPAQADVIAVARCFTGWTICSQPPSQFVFAGFMHDIGEKVVLGHHPRGRRRAGPGLKVIDILARHPSTAGFISRKLC